MTSFFTAIHLLNLKQYELEHTNEVSCIKTLQKYKCPHGEYSDAKTQYFQSRCSKCEHQSSVKKNIKLVNELFKKYKCLYISWDVNHPLILFFSNGTLVSIEFNTENNTLLRVIIDNYLCGKFLPSRIVDVIMSENCIYVTYTEPKLTLIYTNQDSPSRFSKIFRQDSPALLSKIFGEKGKLVGTKPKIVHVDLFQHSIKSFERKLSLNIQRDLLLVWWNYADCDVWPWTPIAHLSDRVNILVYSVNGPIIELLCSVEVQDELVNATFSKQLSNQFYALVEMKKEREIAVNICVYEIVQDQCHLSFSDNLPVRGSLIAFDWSSNDKLLAADSDGLLIIYNTRTRSTIVKVLEFLPKCVSWHPQNCLALVVLRNNNLMCFDAAFNIISFKVSFKTVSENSCLELGSYFHQQFSIQKVLWQESTFNDTCLLCLNSELSSFILIKFSFGCLTWHNMSTLEIISQYLKSNSLDKAVLLLRSLDWEIESDIKFQCLSKMANFLLRKPLDLESQASLELTLNSFYNWIEIIPEHTVKVYEPKIHHLARRFFHRLLRYHRFRKAFLLAVDLESQDLFLDLYHVAKQKGEEILAAVALHKAEEFDDLSRSCSETCSSYSNSESPENSYDQEILSKNTSEDIPLQSSNIESTKSSFNAQNVLYSDVHCPESNSAAGPSVYHNVSNQYAKSYKNKPCISNLDIFPRNKNYRRDLLSLKIETSKENLLVKEKNEEIEVSLKAQNVIYSGDNCPEIESVPDPSIYFNVSNQYAGTYKNKPCVSNFSSFSRNNNYVRDLLPPKVEASKENFIVEIKNEDMERSLKAKNLIYSDVYLSERECVLECESEIDELEGSGIKLAHLGII